MELSYTPALPWSIVKDPPRLLLKKRTVRPTQLHRAQSQNHSQPYAASLSLEELLVKSASSIRVCPELEVLQSALGWAAAKTPSLASAATWGVLQPGSELAVFHGHS